MPSRSNSPCSAGRIRCLCPLYKHSNFRSCVLPQVRLRLAPANVIPYAAAPRRSAADPLAAEQVRALDRAADGHRGHRALDRRADPNSQRMMSGSGRSCPAGVHGRTDTRDISCQPTDTGGEPSRQIPAAQCPHHPHVCTANTANANITGTVVQSKTSGR